MQIQVQMSKEEMIQSKFINTLRVLSGYVNEAKGDRDVNQNYSAGAVYKRMLDVQVALSQDLAKLSQDTTIVS